MNGSSATAQILVMQFLDPGQMELERAAQAFREQRDALAHAFALADGDLPVTKVDILNPQAKAFEQAQATPVEEMGHEAIVAFEIRQDSARFDSGENDRNSG